MGEGTPHIAGASARVVALAAEATAARERLDVLVAELRRRRDELMDWRTQLRRHRRGLTIVLGGVVAITAVGLAVQIARNRRHAGLAARVAELTDKAERLRPRPRTGRRGPRSPGARRAAEEDEVDGHPGGAVGGGARGPHAAPSPRRRARAALPPALDHRRGPRRPPPSLPHKSVAPAKPALERRRLRQALANWNPRPCTVIRSGRPFCGLLSAAWGRDALTPSWSRGSIAAASECRRTLKSVRTPSPHAAGRRRPGAVPRTRAKPRARPPQRRQVRVVSWPDTALMAVINSGTLPKLPRRMRLSVMSAEPPLHQVQPGTRRWDEVQMEPGSDVRPAQPKRPIHARKCRLWARSYPR